MKKTTIARAGALLTALVFLLTACTSAAPPEQEAATQPPAQPRFSEAAAAVTKSETVYVNLASDGSVLQTTVTDWLHTDSANVYVNDISPLEGIENIMSDIMPVADGSALTWHMDSTDLYYSGTTAKPLPVAFEIEYTLNGKTMPPEEIAGQSGALEIMIRMKNTDEKTVKIDGKDVTMYTPMLAAGVLVLPAEVFSNVQLSQGKAINDATKQIAVLYGIPGMQESLQLEALGLDLPEALSLAEEFTITADVTEFALGNMMFAVLPLSSLELGDAADATGLEDAIEMLAGLEETFTQLTRDGSIEKLLQSADSIPELMKMVQDALRLYQENQALLEVFAKHMTPENIETLTGLMETLNGEALAQAMELLENPVLQRFFADLPQLAENLQAAQPMLEALQTDLADPQVQAALQNLPQTMEAFNTMQTALDENEELLEAFGTFAQSGSLKRLTDMMEEASGLMAGERLMAQYEDLLAAAPVLLDRANAWLALGAEYDIFTDAADGMDANVMFVYETASVRGAEVQAAAQAEVVAQEAGKIKQWWDGLFG